MDASNARYRPRVAAVCIRDGFVLLQGEEESTIWTLPGGGWELMESSVEAVRREMREELGVEVTVGRLLWIVENFHRFENRPTHEIGLYYEVSLPDVPHLAQDRTHANYGNITEIFRWFPLSDLVAVDLLPSFLRRGLQDLPPAPERVEWWDV
jgi:8-oxo-dGTP pyrophosphatase MutT (NUDIX family)